MSRGARQLVPALLALPLGGCYVASQALHQNDLYNTREPVAEVLADPGTSPEIRAKLTLVGRVLRYAQAQGLKTDGAYHYVIRTELPVVSYIVEAAEPDRLEFVTTWFPLIGNVPYLGYFKEAERDAKAAEYQAKGYDVYKSGAGAFSSLGWFDDPIFSAMLRHGEADTAHLFFHELTHRTLWVAGSYEFNENLAEYVAGVLTPAFLVADGKPGLVARYAAKRRDKGVFKTWLSKLKDALTELYDKDQGRPRSELLAAKAAVFHAYLSPPLRPKFEVVDYVEDEEWNNASVLGESLYAPDEERFARAHHCLPNPSIQVFLETLARATDDADDPFAALDGLCAKRASGTSARMPVGSTPQHET